VTDALRDPALRAIDIEGSPPADGTPHASDAPS
jgi:hypothetical protein